MASMDGVPPPEPTSTKVLPPLLMLPLEIKLHIFSLFDLTEPTLIILRRTHRSFYNIIPRAPYAKGEERLECHRFLTAEQRYPYLFPPSMLPCYRCLQVLEDSNFSTYDTPGAPSLLKNRHYLPARDTEPLGSEKAYRLHCDACWTSCLLGEEERRAMGRRPCQSG